MPGTLPERLGMHAVMTSQLEGPLLTLEGPLLTPLKNGDQFHKKTVRSPGLNATPGVIRVLFIARYQRPCQ